MGSLVPGWSSSAPGVPPKGFEESYQQYLGRKSAPPKMQEPASPRSSCRRSSDGSSPRSPFDYNEKYPPQLERRSSGAIERGGHHFAWPPTIAEQGEEQVNSEEAEYEEKDTHKQRWWRRFDSANYNLPCEERREDWAKGSYKPQYDVAQIATKGSKDDLVIKTKPPPPSQMTGQP